MTSGQKLGIILAIAASSSGWIFHYAQAPQAARNTESSVDLDRLEDRLSAAQQENATLRSMLQGGGDVPVSTELQSYVEEQTGLNFSVTPKVRMASTEEMEEAVMERLEIDYGAGALERKAIAWGRLGIIPPEQNVAQQLAVILTCFRIMPKLKSDSNSFGTNMSIIQKVA